MIGGPHKLEAQIEEMAYIVKPATWAPVPHSQNVELFVLILGLNCHLSDVLVLGRGACALVAVVWVSVVSVVAAPF